MSLITYVFGKKGFPIVPDEIANNIAEYVVSLDEQSVIRKICLLNQILASKELYFLMDRQLNPCDKFSEYEKYEINQYKYIKELVVLLKHIAFSYEQKPKRSNNRMSCHEKHQLEDNLRGNFFIQTRYGLTWSEGHHILPDIDENNFYVPRALVILAFILSGYEYISKDRYDPCSTGRFTIFGKRLKFTPKQFLQKQIKLGIEPSYFFFQREMLHLSKARETFISKHMWASLFTREPSRMLTLRKNMIQMLKQDNILRAYNKFLIEFPEKTSFIFVNHRDF